MEASQCEIGKNPLPPSIAMRFFSSILLATVLGSAVARGRPPPSRSARGRGPPKRRPVSAKEPPRRRPAARPNANAYDSYGDDDDDDEDFFDDSRQPSHDDSFDDSYGADDDEAPNHDDVDDYTEDNDETDEVRIRKAITQHAPLELNQILRETTPPYLLSVPPK